MGLVKDDSGRLFPLASFTSIGRHQKSTIRLEDPQVSNLHATLYWSKEGQWELRDAGSRNGTRVDDRPVLPGQRARVAVGSVIALGASRLELIDGGGPLPSLRNRRTGAVVQAAKGMFDLVNITGSLATLVEAARGEWWLELPDRAELIREGDIFALGDDDWELELPAGEPGTHDSPDAAALTAEPLGGAFLSFSVTPDFGYAQLCLRLGAQVFRSEGVKERLLAHLAHSRLLDKSDARIHPAEQGWVYGDDLCTWLNLGSLERLNVEIYRLRQHFLKCKVPGAPNVIQRRRGTGQLRVGTDNLAVSHEGH